ncbi:kinesin-related protein 4 isoform X1 [Musca domestica]|uniref:Kinesin-related protein 4 isoform X1 n=1 Tax=Musca domestica TaxID=7370 RepID=A0A9J7CVM6_MUSDO|nr:kinesin-related protein 4 isoform X1 [Musca domestica]
MTDKNEYGAKKLNLADLSKIPANEFEQHFHEWMERDDVARALQAKLRCDLIQNFNKTNLGKQIQAHTMSTCGGSTYRLTLSPLILALNTLVAEFLYAQNCHFTLSVFCTEVPFRNTLPDFESMRHYRFNEREINEIWEAVTGTLPAKRCLDSAILEEYETDASNSLLLLILKSLLKMKPQEMLHRTVEIQTEDNTPYQQKQSISVQATAVPPSPNKSKGKSPDNLRHINKYLLILSQKVNEMTREFEMLVRQKNLQKPQKSKSARSRDFLTLNKSLERINENVKQLTKSKTKSRRLTNVVESIDNLTKQFSKCAESFGQVTRELTKKERQNVMAARLEKTDSREKQTETVAQEKTYAEWIEEMRTTENGRKFLERVEHSLSKAVAKHKEQWQNENEIKMKQMKSLIKLHYKQKMLALLSRQSSEEQTNEARKLNETIEMKLKNFETKQMELLEKLQESSFELQEAQRVLQEKVQQKEVEIEVTKKQVNDQDNDMHLKNNECRNLNQSTHYLNNNTNSNEVKEVNITRTLDISEENFTTPRDQKVEYIINEAKIRLKQLETESNCLEKHFQNYLERRRKENQSREDATSQLIQQSQRKTSEILSKIGSKPTSRALDRRRQFSSQSKSLPIQEDFDLDEEFMQLKEKLTTTQVNVEMTPKENSPVAELKNAILDAKNKFFENEQLFRERKERELIKESISNGRYEDGVGTPANLWNFSTDLETQLDVPKGIEREQIIVFNINTKRENDLAKSEDSLRKPKSDNVYKEEQIVENKSKLLDKKSPRRELFPSKEPAIYFEENMPRRSSLPTVNTNLRQTLKDLKTYTQSLEQKKDKSEESSEELIKQSMAKMKELFEEIVKAKAKLGDVLENTKNTIKNNDNIGVSAVGERTLDTLDLNLTNTTTTTTHTTTMTSTSAVSLEESNFNENLNTNMTSTSPQETPETQLNMPQMKQIAFNTNNKVIPLPLQLTSDSEDDSLKLNSKENQDSAAGISEISSDEDIIMPNGKNIAKMSFSTKAPDGSIEIGEAISETQPEFISLPRLNSTSESSESTDPALVMPMDRMGTNKKAPNSSNDESEGDFWA